MIMIIQIALGILLAVVILAAFPLIFRAIGWVLVILVAGVLLIALVWGAMSLPRIDPMLFVILSVCAAGFIIPRALERPLETAFGTKATPWLQVAIVRRDVARKVQRLSERGYGTRPFFLMSREIPPLDADS